MKKALIVCLLISLALPIEMPAEAAIASKAGPTELKAENLFRKKRARGYRKKKGFLWGIFRKKNPCGCPNH